MRKIGIILVIPLLIFAFFINGTYAADVDVFAEAAYTEDDVEVCVYAAINDKPLISFGVLVGYDDAKLTVASAEKNEADWYFGNGGPDYAYMEPETANAGDVVIIGGKLDESAPTAGVTGLKRELGKVIFNRDESSMPLSTTITLNYGRGDGTGSYKNFVANDGEVKDGGGVAFLPVTVYERGDANEDGVITNSDIFRVRDMVNFNEYTCVADCNNDGVLTNSDIFCVRDKI
jgi:hypothetical protein